MDIAKRNKIVARASGITLGQVESYLTEVVVRPDGSWLAYFGQEVERDSEVAGKLPASKTVEISKEAVRSGGGFDHDNG
ncbi:hypothetical protein [Pseudomonas rubra]|uniref:Uncharacterized protein n=1 Tax=Pseudomonas rubra TaxID=2942627 RepID=A0ABT5P284_9PSED|nr:hypothetical protein [Pseudomonas rubra]MDD1012214.1 hypothetical protein [Pseudomonas rubra]MDD1038350.1 hypothetical protein [Pseudomonas rubra]MDD1153386.1 hypothetical protein [Pseudomonas rubra]